MREEKSELRFNGKPDSLRSTERLALLEIDHVIALSIEDLWLERVLDVGTGTGLFAEAFAAKGLKVVGIDVDDAMLEAARRLVPEAVFTQARAEAIPYGDGEFDLSFLGFLLHETDDPVQVLMEARRVSRSRVVVLEWPFVLDGHKPPIEQRLSVDRMLDIARVAGIERVEHRRLSHSDLYRMAVEPVRVRSCGVSPSNNSVRNIRIV